MSQSTFCLTSSLKALRDISIGNAEMAALGCFFFISFLSSSFAANYVIFPIFSRSHYSVFAKIGEELAVRGHKVSKITTVFIQCNCLPIQCMCLFIVRVWPISPRVPSSSVVEHPTGNRRV